MTTFTMYERAGIGFNMDPNSAEGVDLTQSSEMVIDEVLSDDGSTLVVSVSNAGDVAFLGVNYYMSGDYVLIEDFLYFDFEAELLLLIDDVNLEFSAADVAAGLYTSAEFTSLPDIFYGNSFADTIYSGRGNDRLYGYGGSDRLHGETGNDFLYGGAHNDALYGEAGNDILDGGAGNDSLVGASGTDRLHGGTGKDTLTGGVNNDRFDFNSKFDSAPGRLRDTIRDLFNGDKIDLSTIDANERLPGNQVFQLISGNHFTSAGQLTYNARTQVLSGNTDADKTSEFEITVNLSGGNRLDTTDFIL